MRRLTCLWAFALVFVAFQAVAQTDKYPITEAEKAACTPDAERLCPDAISDEDRLLACMKTNRKALSPECRAAFVAGLRKRNLK